MKQVTDLYDKNGVKLVEGMDCKKYTHGNSEYVTYDEVEVYMKYGALCVGVSYESARPIGWEIDCCDSLDVDDYISSDGIVRNLEVTGVVG